MERKLFAEVSAGCSATSCCPRLPATVWLVKGDDKRWRRCKSSLRAGDCQRSVYWTRQSLATRPASWVTGRLWLVTTIMPNPSKAHAKLQPDTRSYFVLRPPAGLRARTPNSTNPLMSRNAVSGEHLATLAHFVVVKLPLKPSSRRFTISRCRALIPRSPVRDHHKALRFTEASCSSARSKARDKASEEPIQPFRDVKAAPLR